MRLPALVAGRSGSQPCKERPCCNANSRSSSPGNSGGSPSRSGTGSSGRAARPRTPRDVCPSGDVPRSGCCRCAASDTSKQRRVQAQVPEQLQAPLGCRQATACPLCPPTRPMSEWPRSATSRPRRSSPNQGWLRPWVAPPPARGNEATPFVGPARQDGLLEGGSAAVLTGGIGVLGAMEGLEDQRSSRGHDPGEELSRDGEEGYPTTQAQTPARGTFFRHTLPSRKFRGWSPDVELPLGTNQASVARQGVARTRERKKHTRREASPGRPSAHVPFRKRSPHLA